VDRSFNLDPSFARALWRILLAKPRSCEWHFEIYPELLSEEDIALLESAPEGMIRFETGIQSCNDAINLACGRFSDWNKSKAMLQALRDRTQIVVHADLLCGLPEQSFEDVLSSIDQLAPCLPEEIQLGMLKVLPDTPMREIAKSQGWIWSQCPPYTVLRTERMDFDELRLCEDLARILNLYWNKGEFQTQWIQLLETVSVTTVLFRLLDWHREHGLPLHSISKGKREEVFNEALL
jgi:anaerobic magnesium-protoporphyrin IX monomethyl ester cyclase